MAQCPPPLQDALAPICGYPEEAPKSPILTANIWKTVTRSVPCQIGRNISSTRAFQKCIDCIFARGHTSRADRRENLHGIAVSHTRVSPLFVAISSGVFTRGGSKMVLLHNLIIGISSSLCAVTSPRCSRLVHSADRRRLTCVLNGAVDFVYRASTFVADVLYTKTVVQMDGDDLAVIGRIFANFSCTSAFDTAVNFN